MSSQNGPGTVGKFFANARQGLSRARHFLRDELWDIDLEALPRLKKFGLSLLRVGGIVYKGFTNDACTLQASALTYFTLMSMVPVLALTFSISKGFEMHERLMHVIGLERVELVAAAGAQEHASLYEVIPGGNLAELPPEAAEVAKVIFTTVDRTSFGALGAVGVALLFWTVIKVMGKIEKTFNVIWGVHEPRPLMRKFADFISVLITVPVMMLVATSANAMLSSEKVTQTLQARLGPIYWVYERGLGLTGLLIILLAFMFLYLFMPNTRVRLLPAISGAVVGGGLWYIVQGLYFSLQVGLAKNNAIYGTFAAIPFFLFWVYASWLIVLFGAEVSFAVQNRDTYALEHEAAQASYASRILLGMLAVHEICKDFLLGRREWSPESLRKTHNIPVRLVGSVLAELAEKDIIVATGDARNIRYVPARDIGRITLGHVEQAMHGDPGANVQKAIEQDSTFLQNALQKHFQVFRDSLATTSFREMLEREEEEEEART